MALARSDYSCPVGMRVLVLGPVLRSTHVKSSMDWAVRKLKDKAHHLKNDQLAGVEDVVRNGTWQCMDCCSSSMACRTHAQSSCLPVKEFWARSRSMIDGQSIASQFPNDVGIVPVR